MPLAVGGRKQSQAVKVWADRSGKLESHQRGLDRDILFICKRLLTGRLICVDLPKVWCHSQKALKKKLHSYIARTQQFITMKEVQ